VYFPSIEPLIKISFTFRESPSFTCGIPFCALTLYITADFFEIILQYLSLFKISGFFSASTIFIIAFVPFISIPIHAISSLCSLIVLFISCLLILCLFFPILTPSFSKIVSISSLLILFIPCISMFHIKFDARINDTPTDFFITQRYFRI